MLILLNLVHFILEFISLVSLPVFATLLIDKEIILNKAPSLFQPFLIENNIILYFGIFLLVAFIIKNLFLVSLIYFQEKFVKNLKISLSTKMFNFYLNANYQTFFEKGPYFLSRNVTHEIQALRSYLFHFNNLFREIMALVVIFSIIFITSYKLALGILIVFSTLSVFYIMTLKPSLKKKALENQNINQKFSQLVFELFGAIKDIKIFSKEKQISNKFNQQMTNYENNLFFFQIFERLPKMFLEIISIIFIVALCIFLSLRGENTPEILAFLSFILISVIRSIPAFTGINTSLYFIRIFEPSVKLLNAEKRKIEEVDFKDLNTKLKNNNLVNPNPNLNLIEVNNISFNYNVKNKIVLNNLNMHIKEGEIVGIVGETGTGKSTLMQILIGLLKPDSGNIFYKNKDIFNNIKNWHDKISYVSQSTFLLDDSLKVNIAFEGDASKIDEKKVNKAIEIAELKEKVSSLPNGLDENLGTDGVKLSGGEKQRIALARAIYNDKKIIFLDEFTSSLDTKTENKIISNLNKFLKNTTFIIIAHRANVIEKCDKVWELKNGSISLKNIN